MIEQNSQCTLSHKNDDFTRIAREVCTLSSDKECEQRNEMQRSRQHTRRKRGSTAEMERARVRAAVLFRRERRFVECVANACLVAPACVTVQQLVTCAIITFLGPRWFTRPYPYPLS